MKKNLLWEILITVVILIVSVPILILAETNKESKESVVQELLIQRIAEYCQKGDFDTAIKEANTYLEANPNNLEILMRLAECYISKLDLTLAEGTAKKALGLYPDNASALRTMALVHKRQFEAGKDDELKRKSLNLAQDEIEKSLRGDPNDSWAQAAAAQIYFYQSNKPKALKAIEAALKLDPQNDYIKGINKQIQSMP